MSGTDGPVGSVMTVLGPVDPGSIGSTLPHEHLAIDLWSIAQRFDYPHLVDDPVILAAELEEFTARGGTCVVDVTPPDIGRRPDVLRELARRTGLAIVMGAGWYRAPYYRGQDLIERRSVRDLAAGLIAEIVNGVGDTGIRPGVIGEIGVEKSWVAPIEERTHRAAGQAQAATGLPILTHSVFSEIGLEQLTIFELEGADPSRVAIGHADSHPHLAYLEAICRRGAFVMFDSLLDYVGRQEDQSIALVRDLVDRGFESHVLLSLDVCKTPHLRHGGGPGFAHLVEHYLPRLHDAGLPEAVTRRLTVDNPRRWLTIRGA